MGHLRYRILELTLGHLRYRIPELTLGHLRYRILELNDKTTHKNFANFRPRNGTMWRKYSNVNSVRTTVKEESENAKNSDPALRGAKFLARVTAKIIIN